MSRMAIDGEFSTHQLQAFIPRPGSKLHEKQQRWENQNPRDNSKDNQLAQLDVVRTPLFMRGGHGIGEVAWPGQRGRSQEHAD